MEGSKRLIVLVVGLCVATSYVSSLKVFGNDPNNPNEDVTYKLEKQRAEKENLERLLAAAGDEAQKARIQKDLDRAITAIGKMEVQFRVVYRDHLEAIAEKTEDFEKEKEDLKNQLDEAEKKYSQAVAKLEESNKADSENIEKYQKELEESAKQKDRIEKEYAALTELHYQQEERIAAQNEQLNKLKDEWENKLKNAQDLHAKAIAVVKEAARESVKPVDIPFQAEINLLHNQIAEYDEEGNNNGLMAVQTDLLNLQEVLKKEGNLDESTPMDEMKDALVIMEVNTRTTRDEQKNAREGLLNKLSKKKLEEFMDEDIKEIEEINQAMSVSDMFLHQVSKRQACIEALIQVANLMEKAEEAIERNSYGFSPDLLAEP